MTNWSASDVVMLEAVVDRIIPQDQDAGALATGALRFVTQRLEREPSALAEVVRVGLGEVERSAEVLLGRPFGELAPADRDRVLARRQDEAWFRTLAEFTAEGFYADPDNGGNAGALSWRMVGYDPRLPERATPPRRATAAEPGLGGVFDAIVVGAGAAGGVVACLLAEAGHRVLLLERGRDQGEEDPLLRDHLRNQRLSAYGHNAGPEIEGHPRVLLDPDGGEHVLQPHETGYHNNAAAVGSGTLVYGGQAWRFHPDDFRMASRYGVPPGSALADWPIGYDDLEPYYERAEWEIGVSGEPGHPARRDRPFPLPPVPGYASRRIMERGAQALGLATFAPPLLINTLPRDGRAPCVECGSCVGFRCPSDGKNGTQNTVIPRALRTGRCTLVTAATVASVDTDEAGTVRGVTFIHHPGAEERRVAVGARAVVVCAGAIETARLLLLSRSKRHRQGLGNAHDLVGRHLQGHFSPMVYGLFEEETYDPRGPGVTVATCRYNHGNPGIIGGAMIADDFIMLPVIFWKRALPPDVPRWGAPAKAFMRQNYRRVVRLFAPVQEIPTPETRVTLDERVRDRFKLPVARLSGVVHPETVRTAAFMRERAQEWLMASGALRTWSDPMLPCLSGGQHQAGTCRMGTDRNGQVWGHDNLYVCDGSLHPTNGGFNPVLTIMAMAFRNGEHIVRKLSRGTDA